MTGMKAVVLVVPEEHAEWASRLVASVLSINGVSHNDPSVIDWPAAALEPPQEPRAEKLEP